MASLTSLGTCGPWLSNNVAEEVQGSGRSLNAKTLCSGNTVTVLFQACAQTELSAQHTVFLQIFELIPLGVLMYEGSGENEDIGCKVCSCHTSE